MLDRPPQTLDELHDVTTEPPPEVVESLAALEGDVVVAGAGGKMGFHLCRMLQRGIDAVGARARVVAVSRFASAGATDLFDAHRIDVHRCDLRDPTALAGLPDTSTVFFLAGIKFGTADDPEALRVFNIEVPRNVARRYAGSTVVALSTGCVYPLVTPASGGSKEGDRPDPPGAYAESCLGRETAFAEASQANGTPVVLLRLNYAVDLRYGVLVDIAEKIVRGEPVDVTTAFVNVIWQGDALATIIRAREIAASPPAIINVTGDRVLRVREVALELAAALRRSVTFCGTEAGTAWLTDASRAHGLFGPPRLSASQLAGWVAAWVGGGMPTLGKPTAFENRSGKF